MCLLKQHCCIIEDFGKHSNAAKEFCRLERRFDMKYSWNFGFESLPIALHCVDIVLRLTKL